MLLISIQSKVPLPIEQFCFKCNISNSKIQIIHCNINLVSFIGIAAIVYKTEKIIYQNEFDNKQMK